MYRAQFEEHVLHHDFEASVLEPYKLVRRICIRIILACGFRFIRERPVFDKHVL